eukprot:6908793-Heterocapsa_arctica.AAC.1
MDGTIHQKGIIQEPCRTASRADKYIVDKVERGHFLAGDNAVIGHGHISGREELSALKDDDSIELKRLPATDDVPG